jgi:fatty-acyl-CoA synthase
MKAQSIADRVLAMRESDPGRLFCVAVGGGASERITFGALVAEASRYANGLRALGVRPNHRVVIILDFSPDCYYAFLGAMLIGAQPTFLAPLTAKQAPELYYDALPKLMARLEADAIVTSAARLDELRRRVPELPARTLEVGQRSGFPADLPVDRPHTELAFLQLSSGTTGLRKAVALSHRAVLAQIDAYQVALSLRGDDVIASWLPLYHDMGLIACMILPMVTGVPVIAMDALRWVRRPAMFLRAVEEHRATLAWLPNFAFHHLAAGCGDATFDLSSLRAVINCSEPCKAETFERFARRFAPMGLRAEALQCCYAMAENVFAVSQSGIGRAVRVDRVGRTAFARDQVARPETVAGAAVEKFLSCGSPLPNVRLRVVGAAGTDLPERHVGEILVSSDSLFDGYLAQPDLTARVLRDGWYHTGDLGYLADGELFVAGRKDDLIISHGRNFYAHEIERVVDRLDGVIPGRNIALGVYDAEIGSQAVVVLAESHAADTADDAALVAGIRAAVAAELGIAIDTAELCRPGVLVKTSSGKLSRGENLRRYLDRRGRQEGV